MKQFIFIVALLLALPAAMQLLIIKDLLRDPIHAPDIDMRIITLYAERFGSVQVDGIRRVKTPP